jgi:hypothetical protein
MVPELEALAGLEHQQCLAGIDQLWALHENQLWAKREMRWATMASFLLEKKEPTVG